MAILRVLLVLIIIVGGVGVWKGLEVKKQREEFKSQAETSRKEADSAKADASAQKAAKETAETRLASVSSENDRNKRELENISSKLVEAKMAEESLRHEQESLKKDLAEKSSAIENIKKSLPQGIPIDQIAGKIKELQEQVITMEQEQKILNEQLPKLQAEIKRLQYLDDLKRKGEMPSGLTGHILSINPEWGFCVLDIGANQGVLVGGEMMVHRGGNLVSKIRISSVEPNISIADFMPEWNQAMIQEGDLVSY